MVGEAGGRQYGGISLTFSSGILRQTVGFLPSDTVLGNALLSVFCRKKRDQSIHQLQIISFFPLTGNHGSRPGKEAGNASCSIWTTWFIRTSKAPWARVRPIMSFDLSPRSSASGLALGLSVFLTSIYVIRTIWYRATYKLPPGPKGIPFFGNLFQLSTTPWKEFEIWRKQYGKSIKNLHVSSESVDPPPQIP